MQVSASIATLELAETFVISRESADTVDVVQVEIRHDGKTGYGEGSPIEHYGESAESAVAYIEENADVLGDDPWALDHIEEHLPREQFAARSALDAALHDLQGKLAGLPVWRLLGLHREGPPTSWTIWLGDPDDMARRAAKVGDRFLRLKLKLGARDGLDVERVKAVRALGIGVMLGCMIESGLGIAAAAQIASLCDHVDLDGNLLLAQDPWPGVTFVDGVQLPSDEPGLGVGAAACA